MTTPIGSSISPPSITNFISGGTLTGAKSTEGTPNFQEMLTKAVENTAALDLTAQQQLQSHLIGGDVSSVEVFSSMKKADLALKMMLQVRNKLLEGFNEIKQMQM
ncbi:MAG: hypothetical protein Tsb009_02430 [Planctomycetaceae bacterium]